MVVREARNEEGRVLPRLPETRKNRGLHRRRLRWRNGPDNPVGDTRGGVWRSFKTMRRVEVFKTARSVEVFQDDEKSEDVSRRREEC